MNVSIVRSPQQSVFFMLREIAGGAPTARTARSLRTALSDRDRDFALHPIRRQRAHGAVPNALVPLAPHADVSVAEQVAALRAYSQDDLVRDITGGDCMSEAWQPVARKPARWLTEYAEATMAGWRHLERGWNSARPALDRETERIGVAAVRGGLGAVLNMLSPRLRFADDCLFIEPPAYLRQAAGQYSAGRVPFAGRRLHLVPSVGPADSLFVHVDESDLVGIAYPVRTSTAPVPEGDPLAVVLGAVRAELLRMLDRPYPVGEVAAHLGVSAGSTTWHCNVLERAGLVERERRGQRVLVSRTVTGSELLELMQAGNGRKTGRTGDRGGN